MNEQEGTKNKLAHPFLPLMTILVVVAFLSNFIPSGVYERIVVDGRTLVDPQSFHYIEKHYLGIGSFFVSFYHGFVNASGLMAMVLFVGAGFGVVKKIGLMHAAISTMAIKMKHVRFGIVALVLMLIIGLQVTITGMWELSIVIIPIVVPLCLTLGYDVITGAGIVILASCAGFGAAFTNPFFTAIAHQIAELPIYSGIWYRAISFVVIFTICYLYLMRYARKVKAQPERSMMMGIETQHTALADDESTASSFTPPLIRAGIVFLLVFAFLIYGTVELSFGFPEMSGTFAAMGILIGIAYGCKPNEICEMFGEGMKEMFYAAMVMLFARAILHILQETFVIDTIIKFLAQFVIGTSPMITGVMLCLMQTVINFLIPSGSGQAMLTIPIIVPLADMAGVTRQVACLASQFGDGFSNFIYPTNGSLIAILMVAGIPYTKWFKFFAPLFGIIMTCACILVAIAVSIHYGPF